ncbi:hypothetical protein ACHQM5_004738 [Ranunculus cassubicifolius]
METSVPAFFFALLAFLWYLFSSLRAKKGPPSPLALPLIGHLHLLGNLPHQNLQKLSKKYGPIMSIKLSFTPAIVISSPEYAELFLKTHDAVFASRPHLQISQYLSYNHKNLVYAEYGQFWRNIRKLCTIELLSASKIDSFKPMRREEVTEFVVSVKKIADSASEMNVTAKIESLIEGMTYRMLFGSKNKYDFKTGLQEAISLLGHFNIADYISWLEPFDLQGMIRRIKAISKVLDANLEEIIDEHARDAQKLQGKHRDFVDMMLSLMDSNKYNTRELQLDRDYIKAIMLDMIGASIDTTSTTVEWTIAEALKNPRVMKLIQEELENVVGLDRMVEETDLPKLDYLNMVINESMRLHPVLPLLIPHESTEDVTVNGYFIPKKSRVLVNTWAIGRDPHVWSDNVEEFYPERFSGSKIDVQGHDFQLLPFGSGRRKCPGMQLGLTVVQLVLAQLFHCFKLDLPIGMSAENLDMTEKFGLTLPRASHLTAIPSYRLQTNV